MRYQGQGHDLTIAIPPDDFGSDAATALERLFAHDYERVFGITIPGLGVEVMSWALRLAAPPPAIDACPPLPAAMAARPVGHRDLYNLRSGGRDRVPLYWRFDLLPGTVVEGPAIIAEDETSTLVGAAFTATINALGHILLQRR
jgi:N-methylhydantoinase A